MFDFSFVGLSALTFMAAPAGLTGQLQAEPYGETGVGENWTLPKFARASFAGVLN